MSTLIEKLYNPLNKFVRGIKNKMKTNEFRTSVIMVLIPLAFATVSQAITYSNLWIKIPLDLTGIILITVAVITWNRTWKKLKEDEELSKQEKSQQQLEHRNNDVYFQSLISEVKGLRQDISGLRHDLTNIDNNRSNKKGAKI